MSDQPGFRQPEPQQSPDYQATPEPYVPFGQDETTTSFGQHDPTVGSQTEPMPTYPPAAPRTSVHAGPRRRPRSGRHPRQQPRRHHHHPGIHR